MAAKSKGLARTLKRAKAAMADGNSYEALQSFKSGVTRLRKRKALDDALALVQSGVEMLVGAEQWASAADLAGDAPALLTERDGGVKEEGVAFLLALAEQLPVGSAQLELGKAALDWSKGGYSSGAPTLHALLARAHEAEGDFGSADSHYRRAFVPEEHARCLLSWAAAGMASERDLFITRAVLQLAALENLRDAFAVYDAFRAGAVGDVNTPLMNFCSFLLRTLQRDALPLFKLLRRTYAAALRADSSLDKLLNKIAHKFYGVPLPAAGGMGGLMSMLGGMLGGGGGGGGGGGRR